MAAVNPFCFLHWIPQYFILDLISFRKPSAFSQVKAFISLAWMSVFVRFKVTLYKSDMLYPFHIKYKLAIIALTKFYNSLYVYPLPKMHANWFFPPQVYGEKSEESKNSTTMETLGGWISGLKSCFQEGWDKQNCKRDAARIRMQGKKDCFQRLEPTTFFPSSPLIFL